MRSSLLILMLSPALALQPRPALVQLHRLRGGATARDKNSGEPPLSPKTAAYVTAWAVLPTLLRVGYAAATDGTTAAPEPIQLTLAQSIGLRSVPVPVLAEIALPFPKPWQALLAATWIANNLAVMVPGRYDSRSAMAAEKTTAATANLFTPAGWAFAIWAPIFLGEWLMMLYLVNVPGASTLGAAVAPAWSAAAIVQTAWCYAFRPDVCGPALLWVPALLLATTGVFLGISHRALRSRWPLVGPVANAVVRWPIALHFGWISAASLVNLNNWLARRESSLVLRERAALGSVAAAVAAAAYVTASTRDPIFAAVIAWALAAVAADGAKSARGLVADAVLDRVRKAARAGCGLAALLVCSQL